jgi:hypothetical protein
LVQKEVQKLNLKGLEVVTKLPSTTQILDAQTALDFYEAVNAGIVRLHRIVALGGESLNKPGYYLVKLGTPLRELIELAGGLKHTYSELDAYKEQAQMAVFDQIQIKKEIKQEQDKQKKQALKQLLKQKTEEAQQTVFCHFKEQQNKYALCLADMVFLENNNWFSANSLSNSVDIHTSGILFLSNQQKKKKNTQ